MSCALGEVYDCRGVDAAIEITFAAYPQSRWQQQESLIGVGRKWGCSAKLIRLIASCWVLLVLSVPSAVAAQWEAGLRLGVSLSDISSGDQRAYPDTPSSGVGVTSSSPNEARLLAHVGGTASYSLSEITAVQLDVLYSQKGISQYDDLVLLDLTYLDFQLSSRIAVPRVGSRVLTPVLHAGGLLSCRVSCGTEFQFAGSTIQNGWCGSASGLRKMDVGFIIGPGLDIRGGGYTLAVSTIYQFGLVDVAPGYGELNRNRTLLLSVGVRVPFERD